MPRRKYVTSEEFKAFLDNHFAHLVKDVARVGGRVDVLLALGVGAFVAVMVVLVA